MPDSPALAKSVNRPVFFHCKDRHGEPLAKQFCMTMISVDFFTASSLPSTKKLIACFLADFSLNDSKTGIIMSLQIGTGLLSPLLRLGRLPDV